MRPEAGSVHSTAAVIPAYNASPYLPGVITGVERHIPPSHIVVVDDGSVDDTFAVASARGVLAVRHAQNRGKGAALTTGILHAGEIGCEFAITLDADGQHNPDEIPAFLARQAETGADIVVGNRLENPLNMPTIRLWTNYVTSWVVSRRAHTRIPDSQNGYRMIRTSLYARLGIKSVRYEAESELLIRAGRAGARIDAVPVETIYAGEHSAINPFVDTYRFFRMVAKSVFW